jgi:hypothetical protein
MWHAILAIASFVLTVVGNAYYYKPWADREEAEKRGRERILRSNGLLGRRD